MTILGIDPGYAIMGYGVVTYVGNKFKVLDFGAITTDSKDHFVSRLEQLFDGVTYVIEKWKPASMGIEKLFFNTNTKTALQVAEARGCALLAAVKQSISIAEYTPLQVKQAVTGYGRADKPQMMEMTRMLLNLDHIPKPDDAADALAIAICHAHSSQTSFAQIKNKK